MDVSRRRLTLRNLSRRLRRKRTAVVYPSGTPAPFRPVLTCSVCALEFVHYNASNEPCDALGLPCACGGIHSAEHILCPHCKRRLQQQRLAIVSPV